MEGGTTKYTDGYIQLILVPLEEMEEFLATAMEVLGEESDLEKRKMKAAEGQLELIRLSQAIFHRGSISTRIGLVGEDIIRAYLQDHDRDGK